MNQTITTFGYPDSLIKDYKYWVMLLRPEQITVGSLVLAAKSEAKHLGELSNDEWAEFATVANEAEVMTRLAFGAEKFNYLALMMRDPNVHFHFIPRYSKPVAINGHEFVDTDWPKKTELKPVSLSDEDKTAIKKQLLAKI